MRARWYVRSCCLWRACIGIELEDESWRQQLKTDAHCRLWGSLLGSSWMGLQRHGHSDENGRLLPCLALALTGLLSWSGSCAHWATWWTGNFCKAHACMLQSLGIALHCSPEHLLSVFYIPNTLWSAKEEYPPPLYTGRQCSRVVKDPTAACQLCDFKLPLLHCHVCEMERKKRLPHWFWKGVDK